MPRSKSLSTSDVARVLGVAVSSVSKWVDAGKLVAGRTPGGHRRIETSDIIEFLHQQKLRVPPELQMQPPRVLIVDDEKTFAKWLAEEISERFPNCEVIKAHDGYSAGEIIGLTKPETVLLDLHMPGLDGFEVCRRIKTNPLLKDTHVIAITGDTAPAARSKILRLGASACLVKPFEISALVAEVMKSPSLRR